jgi:hypothetical protein
MVTRRSLLSAFAVVLSLTTACAGNEADSGAPRDVGAFVPGGAGVGGSQVVAGAGGSLATGGGVPCNVASVVQNNCHRCHGPTPLGGAIKLVTLDDWHQVSPFYGANRLGDPTKQVYQVAQIRINNGEMPQGGTMAPADLSVLDSWLGGGALAASAPDATCQGSVGGADAAGAGGSTVTAGAGGAQTAGSGPVAGAGGTAVAGAGGAAGTSGQMAAGAGGDPVITEGGVIDFCTQPGAFDPPTAGPGETCYDFPVHAPGGTGKFTISPGESYHEWYYGVPWGPGEVLTRYGGDFDNLQVLHHYLMFTSSSGQAPGTVLQNVTGTTLGTSATLIGGWAVGGCNTWTPDDVGGKIPQSPNLMIQWHMYNNTGVPQQDGSIVRMCTVPAGARPNTASITFLGTENFFGLAGMPPGMNDFTTNCTNNSGGPITLVGFTPHMHLIGVNMKTDLQSGGSTRTIFDMPFQFDYQVGYMIPKTVVLQQHEPQRGLRRVDEPGDVLPVRALLPRWCARQRRPQPHRRAQHLLVMRDTTRA